MRFPLVILLVLVTVGVGCSSGPTLTIPYHDKDLNTESLIVVSEVGRFDLSDDQVATSNLLDMHINAREIIAEAFDLHVDTVETYKEVVLDTLLARVVERIDVEGVELAAPDSSLALSRMRVRGQRRSPRTGTLDPYITHLYLPAAGSHFTFGGYSPDYVLILSEIEVWVEGGNVMGTTMGMPSGDKGMPSGDKKEGLHHRARFVVWDNQNNELYAAGRTSSWTGKEGGFLQKKEFTREGIEKSIAELADALVRETRLPTN